MVKHWVFLQVAAEMRSSCRLLTILIVLDLSIILSDDGEWGLADELLAALALDEIALQLSEAGLSYR